MAEATKPGVLLRALRQALRMTQKGVADATGGALSREYIVKIETGTNQATTDHVRGAFARVYGLSRDQLADYLEGRVSLEQLLSARRGPHGREGPSGPPILRRHPRWPELVEEAMRLRNLSRADLDRIADTPFIWGPLEAVDAAVVADLARDVADWSKRSVGDVGQISSTRNQG